jgi:hypothetical protein
MFTAPHKDRRLYSYNILSAHKDGRPLCFLRMSPVPILEAFRI